VRGEGSSVGGTVESIRFDLFFVEAIGSSVEGGGRGESES